MTPTNTNSVVINNYYNSGLDPEREAVHRQKAVEIAARVSAGEQSKLEQTVSKVTRTVLDKQNAFIFKIGRLSKKVLKKMLLEILPSATVKVIEIAIGVIAIVV